MEFCWVFGEEGDHMEISGKGSGVQWFSGSVVQSSAPSALTVFDQAGIKNEHRTLNVQRRTSNNDVASLRNFNLMIYYFCFLFFCSRFDVGRSMFDVRPFSVRCSVCKQHFR